MNLRTHFHPSDSRRFRKETSHGAWLIRRGALIILGSVGSLASVGCSRGNATASVSAPRLVRVLEIDAAKHGTMETTHYTGVVRARTESNLGFRVAGKIAERLVSAGDAVKKDQPLLKLDPVDYQLALQAARAAVEAARA